jgi:hypothetical protein
MIKFILKIKGMVTRPLGKSGRGNQTPARGGTTASTGKRPISPTSPTGLAGETVEWSEAIEFVWNL